MEINLNAVIPTKEVSKSKCTSLRCNNKKHKESVLCKYCRKYVNNKNISYYCNLLKSVYKESPEIQNKIFFISDEDKNNVCVSEIYYEHCADYSLLHGNSKLVTVFVDIFSFDNEEDAIIISAIHNKGIMLSGI